MAEGEEASGLDYTPTWIVASVCFVIIFISLSLERALHYVGKYLRRRSQKSLFEALLKVKEELMLLGFISLLLTVFQGSISHICISPGANHYMLPCRREDYEANSNKHPEKVNEGGGRRHLLEALQASNHCQKKGKVQLLSLETIHQLHILIFVLAITHVFLSVITICLGGLKIRQWKNWEDSIQKNLDNAGEGGLESKVMHVQQHSFIKEHSIGLQSNSSFLSWLHSFMKQFSTSVTKADYSTLRLGFIMMHCKGNPQFNFHNYMVRAFEADFKKVVGICWYLWIFFIIILLLNVGGWQAFFWITFIPLTLLLVVGTKLEHVIAELAKDVAQKHTAIEGDLVVRPSDDHFWFNKPQIILHLIHYILFQNAIDIACFFWLWVTYGIRSCIMGNIHFILPRLIFGTTIQVLCSFSTLPLYAIVTQMGGSFKKAMFDEHVQESLDGWVQKAKKKRAVRPEPIQTVPSPDEIHSQEAPLVKITR